MSDKNKEITETDLEWVKLTGRKYNEENQTKIIDFIIPLGCLTTVGVLGRGIYFMTKNNGIQQQKYMRYRVLSQGVTLAICFFGIFGYRKYSKSRLLN